MADLSEAIRRKFTGTYTVRRRAAGTYVGGLFVPADETTLQVEAGVYPITGAELMRMSEGMRTREVRQVFTLVPLLSASDTTAPDTFEEAGASWEVEQVENWSGAGGFFRSIVAKVED